jgi:hypothetical protein
MRVFAVIFRVLSLVLPMALATYLWLEFNTLTQKNESFLDEVTSDAYSILQSDKESLWAEVSTQKSAFNEVFESNEPVGLDDANPLEAKFADLRSAEDAILRDARYRDELDQLALEFGPEAFLWDSSAKRWKPNASLKLEPPSGIRDPFRDESKFPQHDLTQDDGSIIKGISKENRLRTVLGMYYRERHNKFLEMTKLRGMVVMRDKELREYQNLFAKEEKSKEILADQVANLTVKLNGYKADLDVEQEARKSSLVAAEQRIGDLTTTLASLEADKVKLKKDFDAEVDTLWTDHKWVIKDKNEEIRLADAAGYKRGVDSFFAKRLGGENASMEYAAAVNPVPHETTELADLEPGVSSTEEITEAGTPSEIARIDNQSGMLLFPVGKESGLVVGNVFAVWKDKREAARIRVQSSRGGYMLAHILPNYGDPEYLRRGESVFIIPIKEETR